jgi:hypothetical protein
MQQRSSPLRIISSGNLEEYQRSPMYHQLIEYLQGGEAIMEELQVPRSRQKALLPKAKRFRLPSQSESKHLQYTEATGASSICLVEEEIPRFLKAAHEDHGHYASSLTLDYLNQGHTYFVYHQTCATDHSILQAYGDAWSGLARTYQPSLYSHRGGVCASGGRLLQQIRLGKGILDSHCLQNN